MEKRIKILYIITIIAILAFLGMQLYWLYGRYEFSLKQCEDQLTVKVEESFKDYYLNRMYGETTDSILNRTKFSLSHTYGDTIKTTRTATITTYRVNAHKILGIPQDSLLTLEQQEKALEIAIQPNYPDVDTRVFDASSAPTDGEAWTAANNVKLEAEFPFTVEGLDSCLLKNNIKAELALVTTDSVVWTNRIELDKKLFKPKVTFYFPYSELECKSVKITCPIHVTEVLHSLTEVLVAILILSFLLIICLIWQFSTVLKLSRLDKIRNTFVTTMIHELKRPISTLKMCVSGIENEKMLADKEIKDELMSNARYALDNLSAYFSKLRDITFNKVEEIPLNITEINLHDLADEICSSVTLPATKSVDFKNTINPDIEISADRSHIYSIIINLVENAIKYSREQVTVTLSASRSEDWVIITVADTGIGISEYDIKSIFNRFYRGKTSLKDIPGMGLGLTYVKLLVEAHGGNIRVDSIFGYGTTFTVTLPQ